MPRVLLDRVTKVFDRPGGETIRALSELSLSVEDKECLVIVGPSGSGKTTALRLIAGLEAPTSGSISIGGRVVNRVPPKDRDVAMVFQSPALYPHLSIYENIAFGLKLRRCPRAEIDQRVREAAGMLGLTDLLESKPMGLSGGQRQRAALGRAIVRRAGVLLLDEPLANVDPSLRAQMRSEIQGLRRQLGTTMIYVTHDHVDAMLLGDRVAVIREGVLQQVAEPLPLYTRPANLFVAGFVGAPPMNFFRGQLVRLGNGGLFFEASVSNNEGKIALAVDLAGVSTAGERQALEGYLNKSIVLGLRPEQIALVSGQTGEVSKSVVRAKVSSIQTMGSDQYVNASSGGIPFVARVPSALVVAGDQECAFKLDTQRACFFDPDTGTAII